MVCVLVCVVLGAPKNGITFMSRTEILVNNKKKLLCHLTNLHPYCRSFHASVAAEARTSLRRHLPGVEPANRLAGLCSMYRIRSCSLREWGPGLIIQVLEASRSSVI